MRFVTGVVQDDQTLDDRATQIGDGSVADRPAKNAKPSDEVGKLLLCTRWAELRNPV